MTFEFLEITVAMRLIASAQMEIGMDERTLNTAAGIPVADNQNSVTAGPQGPVLLQYVHVLEKLQHFNRERIPERVVHAKSSGAHGHFTVTADITR
jgi:catalase